MGKLNLKLGDNLDKQEASKIEKKLLSKEGVQKVVIKNERLWIEWDPAKITRSEIIKTINKTGISIHQLKIEESGKSTRHEKNSKHGHAHAPITFLGENTELYFAITSGVFWILGIILSFIHSVPDYIATISYIISALLGGVFTFYSAGVELKNKKLTVDFLMLFAAIGAAILGKWGESALLLFLFSLGHALEHYAMKRARKSITALSDLTPSTALVKKNDEIKEVEIEKLNIGDIIVVKPNSKIPVDGVVISGTSPVNQAPITGESIPVTKQPSPTWETDSDINKLFPEHRSFAGTINGNGALEIKVLKQAHDSTVARLIYLVKEAESQKSPTQHLTQKFEKFYVPSVVLLVTILMFAFLVIDEAFSDSFYRAMSVLIAASPCALAISTPSAVLAGIARGAMKGVLIKGGRPLEDLGGVKAIAFDKTGTLTQGRPVLTHAIPYNKQTKEQLLLVSVSVEALSDHPLAAAIVAGGKKELGNVQVPKATNLKSITARGIQATFEGSTVHIGNRRLFEELTQAPVPEEIDNVMSKLEEEGHTAMIVHQDDAYLGVISAMDVARPEVIPTLSTLKRMGIHRMVMLTGDHQLVANAIAKNIGITDPLGSLLPEHKVSAINELKNELGTVAMVGDGVNDAPAMAKSTVGIAMGAAGSDVALETADIALMADKLDNLPFAIGLSRKAKQIIKQNLIISLGMVALLVPLTMAGTIAIGPAVVGHEGSTMLVVLNALRLLRYELKVEG